MSCLFRFLIWSVLVASSIFQISCSLRARAVNALADVMEEAQTVYLSDEDPELVAAALPFNLKTIETLLESSPNHRGLLLTAAKSFTFYSYGFVEPEAVRFEYEDFPRARQIRARAARLYRRAYRYGLRGIEVRHPGFAGLLIREPEEAVRMLDPEDLPLAVWTAAALGSAIGASAEEAESTADIALVGALLNRALELDEDFEDGTIQEFLISYEMQVVGGSLERAELHYRQALELSRDKRPSVWLTWAEKVSVKRQDRREFEELLEKVLSFDPNVDPANRLLNILTQRRARYLLETVDDLFLDES